MQEVECNLCGSRKNSEIYKDEKVRYVICDDCSLIYLNPRMDSEEYKKFYDEDYQITRHKVTEYNQAVKRLEKKGNYQYWKGTSDFFKDYINRDSRVLEIGSSWGVLLKAIQDTFGSKVTGVEISGLAAEVAKKYYGLNVYHQTLEEYSEEKGGGEKPDLIIMVHVLEHLVDAFLALKKVSGLLADSGFLYLVVPDTMEPNEPLDRYFHFEHCYCFTPLTLKSILGKQGFKIVKMSATGGAINAIAVKNSNPIKEIDSSNFNKLYSRQKLFSALKRQKCKYKILRFLKRITENLLPPKFLPPLRKLAVKILKKLKIIQV